MQPRGNGKAEDKEVEHDCAFISRELCECTKINSWGLDRLTCATRHWNSIAAEAVAEAIDFCFGESNTNFPCFTF